MKDKQKTACVISSYAYIVNHINYGAILQYYALEKALKQNGINAYWLRYYMRDKKRIRCILKKILLLVRYGNKEIYITKTLQLFGKFLINYCNVSEKEYDSEDKLEESIPAADIYITGSDQVWGGISQPNYLCFAPKSKVKCSYAASFGKKEISSEQKSMIAPWVKRLDFVSVRESSGIDICFELGVNAIKVLDPTLLIDANLYPVQMIPNSTEIFCYFLNISSKNQVFWKIVKRWSNENGLTLAVACTEETYKFFKKNEILFLGPKEWLDKYYNAKYIITNTFHGTVFAVVFNKPFLFFKQNGESKQQNERIYSFLNQIGLTKRIYNPMKDFSEQMMDAIDWLTINKKIDEERKNSIDYICKVRDYCEK